MSETLLVKVTVKCTFTNCERRPRKKKKAGAKKRPRQTGETLYRNILRRRLYSRD